MGFEAEAEEEDDKSVVVDPSFKIYQDHLQFEEMVMGVKQGMFFQGRLNMSRLVQTEASVKV